MINILRTKFFVIKKLPLAWAGPLLLSPSLAQALVHTVESGENLTVILKERKLTPIYGEKGWLRKVTLLNTDIANIDRIYPGDKIVLASPVTKVPASMEMTVTTETEHKQESTFTPEQESSTSIKPLIISDFDISLFSNYFRIDLMDLRSQEKAIILSNLNPTLRLGWNYYFNSRTGLRSEGEFRQYSLRDLEDGSQFTNKKGILSQFNISAFHKVRENLSIRAGVGVRDRLFFRATSPEVLQVDSVLISYPSVGVDFSIWKKSNGLIGLEADAGHLLGSSTTHYKIRSGNFYQAGTYFEHLNSNRQKALRFSLSYRTEHQDTNIATQKETNLFVGLSYRWRLNW